MVDLDALAEAPLTSEPFRWACLRDAITPDEAAEALRETFPRRGFWRLSRDDEEVPMDFRVRPLVPLGAAAAVDTDSLDASWLRLVDELLSPEYRRACERALGQSLDGAPLELSAWRWGAKAELGVHVDIPRKIASQVFYFNESWDPAWGGCLRILGSRDVDDCIAELPPLSGSASILVRSESSWHAVPRVRDEAAGERLSVVATWQHPGSESPFWTIAPDGSVSCHARGAAPAAD